MVVVQVPTVELVSTPGARAAGSVQLVMRGGRRNSTGALIERGGLVRHEVEVEVERGPLGLPRWWSWCSCGWESSRVTATPGVDGEGLVEHEALDHLEGQSNGSMRGMWGWEGF